MADLARCNGLFPLRLTGNVTFGVDGIGGIVTALGIASRFVVSRHRRLCKYFGPRSLDYGRVSPPYRAACVVDRQGADAGLSG
ncbi:hypothetical protein CH278_15200 [Rhodococcus sp. 05-2254-5]|nr:hypothetical protein CH278_15200 [Rhodococcus sp. 05-2254-5]OZE59594.1 hypothetical protein CH269_06985 [Rhodococcus sp. 05-2254-1]